MIILFLLLKNALKNSIEIADPPPWCLFLWLDKTKTSPSDKGITFSVQNSQYKKHLNWFPLGSNVQLHATVLNMSKTEDL